MRSAQRFAESNRRAQRLISYELAMVEAADSGVPDALVEWVLSRLSAENAEAGPMSSERINILIGAGQLLLALLLWFGLNVAGLKKISPVIHTSTIIGTLLIGGLAFSAYGFYRTFKPPVITPENIEPKIRQWLDSFSLATRKLSHPASYFYFEVKGETGIPIAIIRTKEHSRYITLICNVEIGPEHKPLFDKLSSSEKEQFLRRLRLEAAKAKITYSLDRDAGKVIIEKRLPITENFTDADLIDGISDVNFSALIVIDTIVTLLRQPDVKPPTN